MRWNFIGATQRDSLSEKLPGSILKTEIFGHIFTTLLRSVAATLPLPLLDVSFTTRDGFAMLRIDEQYLKLAFPDVPHRFPVDACRLHRYLSDLPLVQPISSRQKIAGHRPKATNLLLGITGSVSYEHTGSDTLLVNIQPAPTSIHDAHGILLALVSSCTPALCRLSLACSPQ